LFFMIHDARKCIRHSIFYRKSLDELMGNLYNKYNQ